jgi:hypothetical protein
VAAVRKTIYGIFIVCFFAGGFYWMYSHRILRGENVTSDLVTLIQKSKSSRELDLRAFKENQWDEVAVWHSYAKIQDYSLDGVWLFGKNDGINLNDAVNIVLFLRNNKIVSYAEFSRSIADFASLRFEGVAFKISRDKAIFHFEGSGDFSKVLFKN